MTAAVEITPEHMLLAGGLFDTHNRYIRKVSSGETMAMVNGASIAATFVSGSTGTVHWRWQVGAATFTGGGNPPGPPSTQTLIAL